MNEDRDIDIATFRRSRLERFLDWRRKRAFGFREWRRDTIGRFTQRGWCETEAAVVSCTAIRHRFSYNTGRSQPLTLGAWAIDFTYVVGGKPYDGILSANDEVQPGDKFTIRYNPDCPDENDTLASKWDSLDGPILVIYDALLVLFFASLVVLGIVLKRQGL